MEIQVRYANAGDADAMTALFLAARRQAMSYLPHIHTDMETRRWMEETVLEQALVVVAVSSDRVMGFAAVMGRHLEHIYVDPAFQSKGIGSRLLKRVQQSGLGTVTLRVFQRNTQARTFYERRGFHLVALSDGSDNEEMEPDALYEWRR